MVNFRVNIVDKYGCVFLIFVGFFLELLIVMVLFIIFVFVNRFVDVDWWNDEFDKIGFIRGVKMIKFGGGFEYGG